MTNLFVITDVTHEMKTPSALFLAAFLISTIDQYGTYPDLSCCFANPPQRKPSLLE
jgi:hypothetical protein